MRSNAMHTLRLDSPPADGLAAIEKRKRAMSTTRLHLCVILTVGLVTVCGAAFGGDPFEIDWHTIDGGGAMRSRGSYFELSGSIGQPDAGVMTNGDFELTGGLWFRLPVSDCRGFGN